MHISIFRFVTLSVAFGGLALVSAQKATESQPPKQPDNTGVNKRDRNKAEPTAGQQKENPSDREITRKIRRAVVRDKSLSTYAHNVKIITQDGAVTLRGPVRSEAEKKNIEAKAAEVAGANVKSELEITPDDEGQNADRREPKKPKE